MSFNRRFLPELSELVKLREALGSDSDFIKRIVGKSDVIMGPSDSMTFVSEIRKKVDEKEEDPGNRPG
jgi:hypothetical protein